MKTVAFDTETRLIERGRLAPDLVCYQYDDGNVCRVIHHSEAHGVVDIHLLSGFLWIGHNVSYDLATVAAWRPATLRRIFDKLDRNEIGDTMLAQQLIDIASGRYSEQRKKKGGYSLETTAARYGLEKKGDDPWRLRYGELIDVPVTEWPQEALDYARHDAEVTRAVWLAQQAHAQFLGDLAAQTRAAFALHLASCWGVFSDPVAVDRLRGTIEDLIASVRADLQATGLVRADGTRDIKAARAVASEAYAMAGIDPKLTDKGEISLDEDSCTLTGSPLLKNYALYAGQGALRARVDDLALGYDLPLQPRYTSLVETGRTSSSKPAPPLAGVQIQNFPRASGARECLVPRDGMCFIASDYSSAELHTFAQVCLDLFGHSDLADVLNAGVDVHLRLAALTMGITYEEAYARRKDPDVKGARQRVKPANFGFLGGMGVDKFILYSRAGYDVIFTREEAEQIKAQWLETTPEARLYFRHINNLLAGRDICTVKQMRVDRYRGGVRYTDACNGLFQSLAADGAKAAMYAVSRACYADPGSALYRCRPWAFIHDEIIIEAPIERAHEAGKELGVIMEREFNKFVPDCPTTCEAVAMDRWSKNAVARYDSCGKLTIWSKNET